MELRSLGKYRLVSELPVKSESCRVYLVRHEDEPDKGRPTYVAKLLQPSRAATGEEAAARVARFEHETRLLAAVNHPCVPSVHASGSQDGVSYIVMDRIDGVDLATLLDHGGERAQALPKELAVYVMGQLADALRHMSSLEYMDTDGPTPLEVVHRNITPRNILLSRSGDAVLVGFHNTRSRWLPASADVRSAGDLAYMAPERLVEGSEANHGTDVFSLAVVLWEMLKGKPCLAGATLAETRENINRFDIGQSSRRVSGLSPKLSEIVRKNLDRDPGRRYTSAYQMLQRLAQSPEAQVAEQSRAQLGEMVRALTP